MVPHKKSGNEETFLPDFALYNSDISSEVRFELMTIEVKAMKPSDNKYESDLVRLGKQLQVMIDKQALFGVADPMAVEVLVRGVWSKFYKMKLDGKGIYALVELSTFHLMRTPSDITLVPGIIERFMQLKANNHRYGRTACLCLF
ncbi:hypothetical protein BCR43DRAFT_440132 [Syncephalastrum racemosum]|uniref:Fungal-type protein kinase domain-containing protein n=1 Tax=Syncephalastrum racemosum TaxID=13706 RepID=A0A1X2HCJ4_SYNRA|nr:hypothetical protein BCR43DRAFT_440132 [Syncephalastrum racemosum]